MKTHVHHLERNFNNVDNVDCAIIYFLVLAFNANTDLESSKEEMIVSSNEDPRSSSREEFQQCRRQC